MTANLIQNGTTKVLPNNPRRTTNELPYRTPTTHFWHQIRSLETQNVVFGIVNPFNFRAYLMPPPLR